MARNIYDSDQQKNGDLKIHAWILAVETKGTVFSGVLTTSPSCVPTVPGMPQAPKKCLLENDKKERVTMITCSINWGKLNLLTKHKQKYFQSTKWRNICNSELIGSLFLYKTKIDLKRKLLTIDTPVLTSMWHWSYAGKCNSAFTYIFLS